MKKLIEKLLSFLRVRTTAAGLEVSDGVLRLVYFDGDNWQMRAIRIDAGVMEEGVIKNREALVTALLALREKAGKKRDARKTNVILCLSSVAAYTQVFNLPIIRGENLDKAVELNLQMASPMEEGKAYSSWQAVGRDDLAVKLEILSAFVDRKIVDELVDVLFETGFLTIAVELRSLALTRVLRQKSAGVDAKKSYLFVNIDNSGLDFLIIRNGALYFEYTNSWRDLINEKGEIPVAKFETELASSLRQVVNFYNQHWSEPLSAVILSAIALAEQAEKVVADNVPLPAVRLTLLMGQPISSEWLVALGCSLRGVGFKSKDNEINLLGDDSRDRFQKEQLIHFMRFWRVLVPISLGLIVLTFVVAGAFLRSTKNEIESRSDFQLSGAQSTEIANLEKSASNFNQAVALVKAAESIQKPKIVVLEEVSRMAAQANITISHIGFQSFDTPVALTGSGPSEEAVVSFKTALQASPYINAVNLPLTGIQTQPNNVSFSMTLLFTPTSTKPL